MKRPSLDLTPVEKQVLPLALRGLSAKQIARALNRSEGTVRDHLKGIYAHAGVRSRGALLAAEIALLTAALEAAQRALSAVNAVELECEL